MAPPSSLCNIFFPLILIGNFGPSSSHLSLGDDANSLSDILKSSLLILGRNASLPQPKFGLESPIDPLLAVAPLRYLHEGDLLKLRLQLNNVTLEGLSTMTVQEVTFTLPENYKDLLAVTSPPPSSSPSSETILDPSSYDFLPELKSRPTGSESGTDNYDYLGESDNDEFEVTSNHDYAKGDSDLNGAADDNESLFQSEGGDHYSLSDPYLSVPQNKINVDAFEDQFMRDYDSVYRNSDANYQGFNGDYLSPDIDYPSTESDRYKRNSDFDKPRSRHGTKSRRTKKLRGTNHVPKPLDLPARFNISRRTKPDARRHSRGKHKFSPFQENNKSTTGVFGTGMLPVSRQKRHRSPQIPLRANVRVAFTNVKIKAQYIIKGRAGGVFTFKEQGRLVLTIPNVFLTSQFNVTLIPEYRGGLRHWKNNRRNHVRVQKVKSRLSLDVPRLSLIPVSRPSEWVRRQLQEKMEELGKGVGKRDGAIRLLLRHWARLLRRLVTKASRQSWSDNNRELK